MVALPGVISFVILLVLASIARLCNAVLCYRCDSTIQNQRGALLCSDFDYSDRFVVECNNSTFCMKKDYTVNLKVPINGTVRGCANQLYETMQLVDNKWQAKSIVEEPYSERCIPLDDKGFRSSKTTYCFCRGDLCNHASDFRAGNSGIILVAAVILNLILGVRGPI